MTEQSGVGRSNAPTRKDVEPTTLLPCPFCGKQVEGICHDNLYSPDRFDEMMVSICCFVFAGGCGASSGWYDTEADAIAAWNRRAEQ